jgi:hypothetical protein
MLNTIYNYFTSGYKAKLAHLLSHKSGVYEVKSINNFMMDILATCISNLTHFLTINNTESRHVGAQKVKLGYFKI